MAEPVKNYPATFQPGSVWDKHPYLLPNLVSTFVVIFGLCVGFLFLEETHEEKRSRTDYGLKLGQAILRLFKRRDPSTSVRPKVGFFDETLSFLAEDGTPRYQSLDSTPRTSYSRPEPETEIEHDESTRASISARKGVSLKQAFTPQVILNIVAYGILALLVPFFFFPLLFFFTSPTLGYAVLEFIWYSFADDYVAIPSR